jgi:hypothetical protein
MQGVDVRHWLAITAANEHFTAIFAEWMLKNSDLLNDCEQRLKVMWLWHSAEESEHKSTAFDLYRTLGGNEKWRLRWFRRVTVMFLIDMLRQTLNNLRHDGTLWKWSTWKSAGAYLFGRRGLFRESYRPWKQYLRKDFHPRQQNSDLSERWLADNAQVYSVVRS